MKSRWKRAFVWSSLGGVMIGTVVAIARKARRPQPAPLDICAVPAESSRISVWTEHFQVDGNGGGLLVQDRYLLQATPFKVWSVLDAGQEASRGTRPSGWRIYHVTHLRFHDTSAAEDLSEQGQLQDRFYGTISVLDSRSKQPVRDRIGRGTILVIRKCSVGGASNGIENGEIHNSAAPILNFRFEYTAVDARV